MKTATEVAARVAQWDEQQRARNEALNAYVQCAASLSAGEPIRIPEHCPDCGLPDPKANPYCFCKAANRI